MYRMRLFLRLIAFSTVTAGTLFAADDPADFEQKGAAALTLSQSDDSAIITAAVLYGKAVEAYDSAGDSAKATEMNSFLYWCKKKMTLTQMDVFLKQKDSGTLVAVKRILRAPTPAPPTPYGFPITCHPPSVPAQISNR